ncbi:aminotransferase class I/II-fold pyridoxal phosphate-dependent enzyme [Rhizobium mongolense]|uniref:aspartate transaminase n=1 Tax=Rhizobium mongolense TaxID=57676 RepID=A0ABR6IX69_9HYPH|nr:aminotransferase class I/II-fold pyridoxal phosphate-dependent enzyme [Rhizobium mongolense]MBB4232515.1 aspartate aminotransferase [Rhizobium mongolense]
MYSPRPWLTGWRIGYLAGSKVFISAVKAQQSHTTSNPNVIAQHAVRAHLERGDGSYERQLRAEIASSRQQGMKILSSLERVPTPRARGGFYYLDLSDLLHPVLSNGPTRTAYDVVYALLSQAGVVGGSGTAFGDPMGLRLSYRIPIDQLEIWSCTPG